MLIESAEPMAVSELRTRHTMPLMVFRETSPLAAAPHALMAELTFISHSLSVLPTLPALSLNVR